MNSKPETDRRRRESRESGISELDSTLTEDDIRLAELGKMMEVKTELRASPQVLDELNRSAYGRKLIKKFDLFLRIVPETTAEPDLKNVDYRAYRLYLFTDLILIAADTINRQRLSSSASDTLEEMITFDEDMRVDLNYDSSSEYSDADSTSQSNRQTVKRRYKLKMWMDIAKLKVDVINFKTMKGWKFIHVTRYERKDRHGNVEFGSHVKCQNVWCRETEFVEKFFKQFNIVKYELEVLKELLDGDGSKSMGTGTMMSGETAAVTSAVSAASNNSGNASSSIRKRRHVTGVKAMKDRRRQNLIKNTMDEEDRNKTKEDDVKKVIETLSKRRGIGDDDMEATFTVEFGPGQMGFALASDDAIGVFVAKTQSNGMASAANVTPGDRIVAINGRDIPKNTSWQECIELLRDRPVLVKFARSAEIDKEQEEKQEMEKMEQQMLAETAEDNGTLTSTLNFSEVDNDPPRKRLHKIKRDRHLTFGTRVHNLSTLELKQNKPEALGATEQNIKTFFEKLLNRTSSKYEKNIIHQLKEIYETEITFVNDLILIGEYKRKFRMAKYHAKCKELPVFNPKSRLFCPHGNVAAMCSKESPSGVKNVLTEKDLKVLFMNAGEIQEFNQVLLKKMQDGLLRLIGDEKRWTVPDIVIEYSPAFKAVLPFFQVYSFYAAQYTLAIQRLEELKKENSKFESLLAKREGVERSRLKDLLIAPVQRLPRYRLLYESLIKYMQKYVTELIQKDEKGNLKMDHVPMETIDKLNEMVQDAQKTFSMIEKIAKDVDEKVGDHHKIEEMLKVAAELGGSKEMENLITPTRKFIECFDVKIVMSKSGKKSDAHFYMFNDLVVIASDKKPGINREDLLTKLPSRSGLLRTSSSKSASGRTLSRTSSSGRSTRGNTGNIYQQGNGGFGLGRMKLRYQMPLKSISKFEKLVHKDADDMYGITFIETRRRKEVNPKTGKSSFETDIRKHEIFILNEDERNKIYATICEAKAAFDGAQKEAAEVKEKLLNVKKKRYRNRTPNNTERLEEIKKIHASVSSRKLSDVSQ